MQPTEFIGNLWREASRYVPWQIGPRREEHARIVAAAMAFPLDQVMASYRQYVSAEEAADIELELRRFLVICAMYPTTVVPMYGPVDRLWHHFITFTREYAAFCEQVAGRFIHHMPAERRAPLSRRKEDAQLFASLYRRSFGQMPSIAWWPDMALLSPTERDRNGSDSYGGFGGGCGGGCGCGGGGSC